MDDFSDLTLIDTLSEIESFAYNGEVYRVTRNHVDPITPSISGGRWALPSSDWHKGTPILYTSLNKDGAKAEIASFLSELNPPPTKKLQVHKIHVTLRKTIKLENNDLDKLGVDFKQYKNRNYVITQKIGSALSFLGFDGLIVPSARWHCDNLMIYMDNHSINEKLEVLHTEEFEWQAWAREHKIIP